MRIRTGVSIHTPGQTDVMNERFLTNAATIRLLTGVILYAPSQTFRNSEILTNTALMGPLTIVISHVTGQSFHYSKRLPTNTALM